MGVCSQEPLCTPTCSQRLKQLSQQFVGLGGTGGWADWFGGLAKDSGTLSNPSEQGTQKKRKSSQISLDSDGEEMVQQGKRSKMDMCSNECVDAAERSTKEETSEKLETIVSSQGTDEKAQPASDSECLIDVLPQHIKVTTDHQMYSVYVYLISEALILCLLLLSIINNKGEIIHTFVFSCMIQFTDDNMLL